LRAPDVAKSPRTLSRFEIYPALPISENRDLGRGLGPVPVQRIPLGIPERIEKLLNWVALEVIFVFSRKVLIEVRVLFNSETFVAFVAAKIPKDFWQF
jgi:hypothetical protein